MVCKYCGGKLKVTDTVNYDDVIIRRRKCIECLKTQYTKEEDYDNDKEAARIVYEYKNKPWLQNNNKKE